MGTMVRDVAAPTREPQPDSTARGIPQDWTTAISLLVCLLALVATTSGIFTASGAHHRTFISLRGETISIQGGGLYANESISGAAQAIGQDAVTLVVGIPLLLVATYLARRGSLRGRLLRAGALWYFAYTYLLMAFGAAFNWLFLVYVALFSASLFAFIPSLLAIDAGRLPAQVSPRFARRTVAGLIFGFGAMLALLWLGRIVPALVSGAPPAGLESSSTLFVQAGDLGLVVPLAILTAVLLLRRRPIGYLLAGVLLVKGAAFGLALGGMILAMAVVGMEIVAVEVMFFATLAILCIAGAAHYLACLPGRCAEAEPAHAGR